MSSATEAPAAKRSSSVSRSVLGTRLAVALVALVCSLGLLFTGLLLGHVVGYVLGGVVAPVLVALSRRHDVGRLADLGVAPPKARATATVVLLGIGLVLAVLHGWSIAWEIAREVRR